MGTAGYCITVIMPDGTMPSGVHIEAVNKDAWFDSGRVWKGTTVEGKHCWSHIDTGANGDAYDFFLRYSDNNGVEWRSYFTDIIFADDSAQTSLRQLFFDEEFEFEISPDIEYFLSKKKVGKEILATMKELSLALKKGMSHSALA